MYDSESQRAPGVAVPVPGAADAVAGLEDLHAQAHLVAQAVVHVQAGEAGADDDGVDVTGRWGRRGVGGGLHVVGWSRPRSAGRRGGLRRGRSVQARTALTTCWKPRSLPGSISSVKKPCVWPAWRRKSTGTPASRSALGVGLALVAQDVVLGGQHDGRRQAGERRRPAAARRRAAARSAASGT